MAPSAEVHQSVRCVLQARQMELEAARLAKEKEDEEAKQVAAQAKKEKEIQKKAVKKERQKLRTTCKVSSPGNNPCADTWDPHSLVFIS